MDGALYSARVMHRRLIAPLYRFVYRVFYVLVDVDHVDALARRLRFFSHNRFNLFCLHDRDYTDAGSLRAFAESQVGGKLGRIRLLTMPRVLGFAFNPLSMWYCEDRDGRVRAVIADVRNTFGERHCYLLEPVTEGNPRGTTFGAPVEKDKCFHVSPFFDLVGRYRFDLAEPGEELRVAIHETREGVPILDATLSGERRGLTDGEILRQVLWMPWMTLKVVAAIHWEALKLWLRGARFHGKPAPPAQQTT
ncbi:MAG TPA: DUF1365 domain-containing protein [Nevskiaceae bacterium]|nr:DUF1365 domain-containing protein [Nevskiaceae bacterium]